MKSTTANKGRWERADGQIAARGANISTEHAPRLDLDSPDHECNTAGRRALD